jgi:hypothetical protein
MKINEKLKFFKIEVDDIEDVNFDNGMIQQIARKYADENDLMRLELVLNENIITVKDKFTGIHSYMGMKVSLEPLEKDISFIVRLTDKPTYEDLEQENKELKEHCEKQRYAIIENCDLRKKILKLEDVLDEIREYIDKAILGYSNWEGTEPLYLKDDEIGKDLLQILDKVKE